jgi:hypothetical protein
MAYPNRYRVIVTLEEVQYDELGRQADSHEIDAQSVFESDTCSVAKAVMEDCAISTMAEMVHRKAGRWLRELGLACMLTAHWHGANWRWHDDRKGWLGYSIAHATLNVE